MSTAGQLAAYAASYAGTKFDWATANCSHHFAAGWVKHMTGRDPLAAVPVPRNAFGAMRQILRLGGSLRSVWDGLMGDHISPKLARVGDIVLFDVGLGAMGICAGRTSVVVLPDGVVAHVPTLEAIAAWRVQC